MSTETTDPRPSGRPPLLRHYEIIAPIGAGGMARVYLALSRGPFGVTKLVVIKQLRTEVAEDEHFVAQFMDEARIALRLSHQNLVHTYEVVTEPGKYFIVMEFLEGQSLSDVLRRVGRAEMPLPEHLWILSQVLTGLQYAHDLRDFDGTPMNVVHRDISPSNVFVTYAGEIKLLDFGIAKAASALATTQNGIVKGKLGYAAPEQLLGGGVDARADIYAVGVMLWEAIARRRRSVGETFLAKMQARVSGSEPPIEEICPGVPHDLAAITRRALSSSPGARHQTAIELKCELDGYLSSVGVEMGTKKLRAFMSRHFQDDSAALWHNIAVSVGAVAKLNCSEGSPSSDNPSAEVGQTPRARGYRTAAWLVAGGLVLLALLGSRKDRRGEATVSTGPSSTRPLLQSPATSDRAPAPRVLEHPALSDSEERVHVQVSILPRSAIVLLDGHRVAANPYSFFVPRDGQRHEIFASAVGYESGRQTLSYARDADVNLSLSPVPKRRNEVARQPATAPPPAIPATEVSERPSGPGANRVLPGADLRQLGTLKTTRSIDERDPYSP